MIIEGVELVRVGMPLRRPFRTSFGTQTSRDILLVRVEGVADGAATIGWGECVAMDEPRYSAEYVDGAAAVIEHFLVPELLARRRPPRRRRGAAARPCSRATRWPRRRWRWPCSTPSCAPPAARSPSTSARCATACRAGVSVGITDTVDELLDQVAGYLDDGYRRIKLKIEPGVDIEPRRAPCASASATASPSRSTPTPRTRSTTPTTSPQLDAFDLLLIEQPLATTTTCADHAALGRRGSRTPICLDESITSAKGAADAIALGACSIVNIKAGRRRRLPRGACASTTCATCTASPSGAAGCSRPGIGRAANVALAALPGFTLPGDTSASDRYWTRDLTEPFVLGSDGHVAVPSGPGLGVEPLPDVLAEVTTSSTWLPAGGAHL